MDIEGALKDAMTVDGAIGVALADFDSGMSLGFLGGGPNLDLEVAAAGNTEVVRAKMRTLARLGLNESVEDILITLGSPWTAPAPTWPWPATSSSGSARLSRSEYRGLYIAPRPEPGRGQIWICAKRVDFTFFGKPGAQCPHRGR